jgi:hypothetical protein
MDWFLKSVVRPLVNFAAAVGRGEFEESSGVRDVGMPVLAASDMIATDFMPSIHDLFSTILSRSFSLSVLIGIDKP